jgi:hypothetical protein
MVRKLTLACVGSLVVGCLCLWLGAAASFAAEYRTLSAGETVTLTQDLTVNVVLVGFSQGDGMNKVDQAALLKDLPTVVQPLDTQGVGPLKFNYSYNVVWAGRAFQNRFFSYLKGIAVTKPLTSFQQAYNEQVHSSVDIANNCWIDAPSVEKWLAANAAGLHVDSKQYTVFLVNWYGRSDFRYHVYAKTNEPDPDTGKNFGVVQDRTKVVAWGGTARDDAQDSSASTKRVWFYDLSAGPDSLTGSWNVDDTCYMWGYAPQAQTQTGATTYRIPPVWEYGNLTAYRPFDDLTGDLAKIVGDVAVKGLFTSNMVDTGVDNTSLSSPGTIARRVEMAVNLANLQPGTDAKKYLLVDFVLERLAKLEPWRRFSASYTELRQSKAELYAAYTSWVYWYTTGMTDLSKTIYPGVADNDTVTGDLLVFVRKHLPQLIDVESNSYQIPVMALNVPDADASFVFGFGYPDPGTGRPMSFALTSELERTLVGYGLTTTTTHEFGHNLGMDHPSDRFDVSGSVYPTGSVYYMWAGAEVNSMMSYVDLNWDFSQFDYDNTARTATAGFLNHANLTLERIVASGHGQAVCGLLREADASATLALNQYRAMCYQKSANSAREAYDSVLKALARVRATFGRASVRAAAAPAAKGATQPASAVFDLGAVSRMGD